ncbi:bifunctional metallophosphatase/5'-nucleotidase [Muriicola soli]|uniref:Bifunctional metallophosphatase/5'-nucleotidase n=1 Tax=Muriicola soli TaxID=2507538 RepID=A0A411EA04_9FLAO|nr:metallophosphatase [Muriicola soli]QBA64377.1 bifunctional metallophosphatase/5'-nucleotidase [Muriicola soli]
MRRRSFVYQSMAGAGYMGLGGSVLNSCTNSARKKITILHTNDVHSHLDPFPKDHATFPDMGGIGRRASLISSIREENPNSLLLDAGDIFQGTPYFNFYGGELEFKLMSKLKYDAATLGNHDFDNGLDGLLAQLPYAKFDFLCSNYDFTNTVLHGMTSRYKVFLVDGVKIGVFGLGINLDGLVTKKLFGETQYLDPVEISLDVVRTLKEELLCDLVICLSHLGFEYRDKQLASDVILASQTKDIDLIIGGHTHTFLEQPVVRMNRKDQPVLINQVGCYGINLGRVDFLFDGSKLRDGQGVSISV